MICYSGGAKGADIKFEQECIKHNIDVIAYSFEGHNTTSKRVEKLSVEDLYIGDEYVREAAKLLNRYYPPRVDYIKHLLLRNYWQIKDINTVFAIADIDDAEEGRVGGGTGYAVAMAINLGLPNIFVYDQTKSEWFQWKNKFILVNIKEAVKDLNISSFAGIGTRDLLPQGINAIESIVKLLSQYN